MIELCVSLLLILGSSFVLIGSLGLVRMPTVLMRLHGPTKATTLGVGALLVASMLYFSCLQPGWSIHELLLSLFLFLSAPVSAHLIARVALRLEHRSEGDCAEGQSAPEVQRE